MLIRPRALSLITTRRCTAACDHCCVGSSPRAHGAIPIPRLHALLEETKAIPSLVRVGFTGGECFLLGDDLDELIAHAHRLALETRVITNGYWAVNRKGAEARVGSARKAGLDQMMLSTGTFHQRFVPVERIVHAARAAAGAGIPCRIAIEVCDQQTFDEALLHAELADEIAAKTVFLGHDPWTPDPDGRGTAALSHGRLIADGRASADGRCTTILDTITVTPDQQLLACCGFPLERLPELRIGSVAGTTLGDALRQAPNDLLKVWLHLEGPHGVAAFVARYVDGFQLPVSASICQACVALQRNARAMAVLAEHGGEAAQAIMSTYIRLNGGIRALSAFSSTPSEGARTQ
jgi:pyruvate-formate lyase-activating enzyme